MADTHPLAARIAQAVGDPGSIIKRRGRESTTQWSARAVIAVLDEADRTAAAGEKEFVDRVLAETGLSGFEVGDDGARLRLVLAYDLAAKMTLAWRRLLDASGAINYVEQVVHDPHTHERFLFIVVRPQGATPHELRLKAEAERDEALRQLAELSAREGVR